MMLYRHLTIEQKREYLRIFMEEGKEAARNWLWEVLPPASTTRSLTVEEAAHLVKCLEGCCADPTGETMTPEEKERMIECLEVIGF